MSIAQMLSDVAAHDDVSPLTARQRFMRSFAQHRLAVASAIYLVGLLLVALFGQVLLIHDPLQIDLSRVLEGPSAEHWLGTDHLGRSTSSRLIVATGVALKAAVLAVGIAMVLGAPLGLLSGYFGGWYDKIAMRVVEAIIALPGLLVAIAILAILGPSLTNAMIALGLAISTAFFRLLRGAALEVREELYVDAARVTGANHMRIVFRHVLPNVTGPLTVQTTLSFSYVLLAEAGLSFIGLGVQPPDASWGVMLATAQNYIYQNPFMAVPPGLMIMFTVLAFNLLGDGLRDALARVEGNSATGRIRRRRTGTSAAKQSNENLLAIQNLEVRFGQPHGDDLAVVTDVSLVVPPGKTVGLVGESGCGKSVTAMSIMGLLPKNGYVAEGSILYEGQDLATMSESELNSVRAKEIGMIFQEPMTSLNPAYTVINQLAETISLHKGVSWSAACREGVELMDQVGIPDAASRAKDYPHQFSGGMAQRVMIAMALSCQPRLLIADEPTTALDVTIQGQVLDLLSELQRDNGLSILLITHDLGVIADMCDEAVVMYAGQVVEHAPVEELLLHPKHPYTSGLLASMPQSRSRGSRLRQIPGRVPPAWSWPDGCRFHPRCPHAADSCKQPVSLGDMGNRHLSRCIRVQEIDWGSAW